MSSAPIVDRIRIIPRPNDFLDRNVGSSGEVFFNRATSSLRVFNGIDRSGIEIARADLANVDVSNLNITNDDINWIPYETIDDLPSATDNHGMFAHVHSTGKAYYAHAGNWIELANAEDIGTGGASVDVADTAPGTPELGNLWLDTNTGKLYIYVDDGDSSQWIQPKMTTSSVSYDTLVNKPLLATVATSGSYNDLTDKPVIADSGFDGTYDSLSGKPTSFSDLTGLAFLAGETINEFSSDGAFTDSSNSAVPTENAVKTYVDNRISLIGNNLTLTGLTTIQQSTEVLNTLTGATGIVVHDLDNGAVFYHSSLTANFTANFTNLPTTDNRTISVVLLLVQGGTAYIPTAVQIDGASQTINWQGASQPIGNANQIDTVSFTLIRTSAAWTVIGSLSTYG